MVFYALLAVVIGLMYWLLRRKERLAREQFFGQFAHSQLRMCPYKIGLVYRVITTEQNEIIVSPIWDGKLKIENGKRQRFAPDQLMPFDASRFF
ncbi:hypothetical protein [uncultured Tateyamaria sp.]|nr:hypothetical protein [uncultured Tateyamaria sp.]